MSLYKNKYACNFSCYVLQFKWMHSAHINIKCSEEYKNPLQCDIHRRVFVLNNFLSNVFYHIPTVTVAIVIGILVNWIHRRPVSVLSSDWFVSSPPVTAVCW